MVADLGERSLRKLSEGAAETDLLDAYPRLTRADIQAALAYAADSLAHETIVMQPDWIARSRCASSPGR